MYYALYLLEVLPFKFILISGNALRGSDLGLCCVNTSDVVLEQLPLSGKHVVICNLNSLPLVLACLKWKMVLAYTF